MLGSMGWKTEEIEPGDLYKVSLQNGEELGYAEKLSNRYYLLHSIRKADIDKQVQRDIGRSTSLDLMWISGRLFLDIWKYHVAPVNPRRYVKLKFDFEQKFTGYQDRLLETGDLSEDQLEDITIDVDERKASSLMITENIERVEEILPQLQQIHSPFKSIKMLRIPAHSTHGGYELWQWGKMTHRAADFRNGRIELVELLKVYQRITEQIESIAWLNFSPSAGGLSLQGAPVTFKFDEPLDEETFSQFVHTTFASGEGPIKIWGNPIEVGPSRYQVYGLDLHMWQQIYLELTPDYFLVFLPKGTCGNTVHRLITNIQHFLTPGLKVWMGNIEFSEIIQEAFSANGVG